MAWPWVINSPHISRFCGYRLTTKTLQSPAVSSEALLGEKITEDFSKMAKIAKNAKNLPKTGPNGLFKRFLSVFVTHKS
jgi:hypothetical protein